MTDMDDEYREHRRRNHVASERPVDTVTLVHGPDPRLILTILTSGRVELWSDRARPMDEVISMLRQVAAGLEQSPRRLR